jgi:hypothetical protein
VLGKSTLYRVAAAGKQTARYWPPGLAFVSMWLFFTLYDGLHPAVTLSITVLTVLSALDIFRRLILAVFECRLFVVIETLCDTTVLLCHRALWLSKRAPGTRTTCTVRL